MTQEDKNILLKDLCARLPYGVKVKYLYWDEDKGCEYPVPMILDDINSDGYIRFHRDIAEGEGRGYILTYLPYLRPMSSITEEEKKELKSATCPEGTGYFDEQYLICPMSHFGEHISYDFMSDILNWLNAHHFDFRGLIENGLALEAPNDMYKTE